MKIPGVAVLLSLVFASISRLPAQTSSLAGNQPQSSTEWHVKERGPNHKVMERTEYELTPDGRQIPHVHQYTELAVGMHYRDSSGDFRESVEEIVLLPNGAGAKADQGPMKVIFPADITGQIEMNFEDQWYQTRVMGLAYLDTESGASVLLGETTNTIGEIHGSNVVIYPGAFDGDCRADVRYTYRRAGMEQDIVVHELSDPASYNFNPETTVLQVYTEVLSCPEPKIREHVFQSDTKIRGVDQSLDFGGVRIGRGRAFRLGNETRLQEGARVQKQWMKLEGRQWLIEQIPFSKAVEELRKMESSGYVSLKRPALRTASRKVEFPAPRVVSTATNSMKLAMASPLRPGYVIDYSALVSITNLTLKADTTYYVNGVVNVSGTVVIEGNTVVKFNPPTAGNIYVDGSTIDCQTGPYRPAVFTSKDDNTVGETISGSTGSPSVYADQNYYLATDNAEQDLKYLRMLYCYCGITIQDANARLSHLQFNHAAWPIYTVNAPSCKVRNVLFNDVTEAAVEIFQGTVDIQHATVDRCKNLGENDWSATLTFTNSIFASVTNWGMPFASGYNVTNTGAAVFQTVGGGAHYLASNSPYRNVGTTNINSTLLSDLAKKTTYPPIAYTNTTFNASQTFSAQAQRDTDTPDLGYHYDPLDYTFGGCVANSNVTFTAGTAVGWFRTSSGWQHAGYAIHMGNNVTVNFSGTATSPAYFVRLTTVQEQDQTAGYGQAAIESWTDTYIPTVRGTFLRCSALNAENNYFSDDWGSIRAEMTHCEFWSGALHTYGDYMFYTNCLMFRVGMGLDNGNSISAFAMRNCTMIGGRLGVNRNSGGPTPFSIRDCVFDGTTLSTNDYYSSNPTYTDYDWNAFLYGSNRLAVIGAHDVIVTNSYNWQTNVLGNYYLPSNSALTNAGSRTADLAGLYHFTMQTNQVKETNSTVDLGCHYVAVDGNKIPVDTDWDDVADYLEDRNGNGWGDDGESVWGLSISGQPQNQSVIQGNTATFSVFTSGLWPPHYQWYFNGTNALAGATNYVLTITNADFPQVGLYNAVVSNFTGTLTSSIVNLTVIPSGPISFTNFCSNTGFLQINYDASVTNATDGCVLELTPSRGAAAGSAFLKAPLSLASNASFSTFFSFRLSDNGGSIDSGDSLQGADGIVFVVQTLANNVGGSGGGLGYDGIYNSVGIEFDTWKTRQTPMVITLLSTSWEA